MKREEFSLSYYDTIEDWRRDVDEYVDFFNNMRPYQRLGMRPPSEAERNLEAEQDRKAGKGGSSLSQSRTRPGQAVVDSRIH